MIESFGVMGFVVTGKIGHRGVSSNQLLETLLDMRQCFPDGFIVLVASQPLTDDLATQFGAVCNEIVVNDVEKPLMASPLWHSLIRQQSQVQCGLGVMPPSVTHVLRLRTDWVIKSRASFSASINSMMKDSRKRIWVASYSSAKMPVLPIPYFINDNLMGGPLGAMTKLWEPYSNTQFPEPKLSKFFSRSFFLFEQATTLMPEQFFWGRYFGASWTEILPESMSSNCLRQAWEDSCSLVHINPENLGVLPPEGIGKPNVIANLFYGKPLRFPPGSLSGSAVSIGFYLSFRYIFFIHPHWIATRVQAILWYVRRHLFRHFSNLASSRS